MEQLPQGIQAALKHFEKCAKEEEGTCPSSALHSSSEPVHTEVGEEVVAYYIKLYMVQLAITKGKEIAKTDPEGNKAARSYAMQ